ncbi:hypothetical protein GCM10028820_29160 [Tessaracoccus terricola]
MRRPRPVEADALAGARVDDRVVHAPEPYDEDDEDQHAHDEEKPSGQPEPRTRAHGQRQNARRHPTSADEAEQDGDSRGPPLRGAARHQRPEQADGLVRPLGQFPVRQLPCEGGHGPERLLRNLDRDATS